MIAQRPLIDFEAGYFKDCYESEIRTKKKIAKIIRILKTSQVTNKRFFNSTIFLNLDGV